MGNVTVRAAVPADGPVIYRFVRALAEYEKLVDAVTATAEDIQNALFGDPPRAFCDIAEDQGVPLGFALWFYNFSTFSGHGGLYLEDLYVAPEARGRGAGKALLADLARRCVREDLSRLDWAVLNWNAPSIAFYDSLGAETKSEWTTRRLSGAALKGLAEL